MFSKKMRVAAGLKLLEQSDAFRLTGLRGGQKLTFAGATALDDASLTEKNIKGGKSTFAGATPADNFMTRLKMQGILEQLIEEKCFEIDDLINPLTEEQLEAILLIVQIKEYDSSFDANKIDGYGDKTLEQKIVVLKEILEENEDETPKKTEKEMREQLKQLLVVDVDDDGLLLTNLMDDLKKEQLEKYTIQAWVKKYPAFKSIVEEKAPTFDNEDPDKTEISNLYDHLKKEVEEEKEKVNKRKDIKRLLNQLALPQEYIKAAATEEIENETTLTGLEKIYKEYENYVKYESRRQRDIVKPREKEVETLKTDLVNNGLNVVLPHLFRLYCLNDVDLNEQSRTLKTWKQQMSKMSAKDKKLKIPMFSHLTFQPILEQPTHLTNLLEKYVHLETPNPKNDEMVQAGVAKDTFSSFHRELRKLLKTCVEEGTKYQVLTDDETFVLQRAYNMKEGGLGTTHEAFEQKIDDAGLGGEYGRKRFAAMLTIRRKFINVLE